MLRIKWWVLLLIFLVGIGGGWLVFSVAKSVKQPVLPVEWGVTFSQKYAESLGLNWQETYSAILNDLGVKRLRLIAYWDEIEKENGKYNWTDLDWQVTQAKENQANIILAVGQKMPRWPECHIPSWAENLSKEDYQTRLKNYITAVVNRYKTNSSVTVWQVENEPLVGWFGKCQAPDEEFYKQEIALVKSLDSRPILVTDSGELSLWLKTANLGDLFGTTLYRIVWNKYVGYWHYWFLPAESYRLKAYWTGKNFNEFIVAELQAEPWFKIPPEKSTGDAWKTPLEEQYKSMDAEKLNSVINYTRKVGFREAYFWGVEWWYWLKLEGDSSVWEVGRELLDSSNQILGSSY